MELQELTGAEVSRRSFIRVGTLAMAGAGLALAGCSSSATTKAAGSSRSAAASTGNTGAASAAGAAFGERGAGGTGSFIIGERVPVRGPGGALSKKPYPKNKPQLGLKTPRNYIPTLPPGI